MSTLCKPLENTGVSVCANLMEIAQRPILVPEFASDGTKNELASPDLLNKALLETKFNDPDPTKRWYPLPNLENVDDVRAETEFFTWESGHKVRIQQGLRTFVGAIPLESSQLLKRLQSWFGQKFGIFYADAAGNWVYNRGKNGEVQPIMVDGNSFDARLFKGTYTDPLYLGIAWDFRKSVNDGDLWYILEESLDFDPRTQDVYALAEVYFEHVVPLATKLEMDIVQDMMVPLSGLTIADFAKDGSVYAGTIAESPIGHYIFTDTWADDEILSLAKTKFSHAEYTVTGI